MPTLPARYRSPPIRTYSLLEPSHPKRWLNVAFTAELTARLAGVGWAQTIMTAAAAVAQSWLSSSPPYLPTAGHDPPEAQAWPVLPLLGMNGLQHGGPHPRSSCYEFSC